MAAMLWDIFCRVIDNFGDIGVCWRLSADLAGRGHQVRLWIDDASSLAWMAPDTGSVSVRPWAEAEVSPPCPGDVVVEAFGCNPPAAFVTQMQRNTPPKWINLEYLTAESWAEGCHGMASPHPTLPLTKYFFFPGFSAVSGGLLRERDLLRDRDEYLSIIPAAEELNISLFCYDTAPVGPLIEALAGASQPVRCHVFPGKPQKAVAACLGGSGLWQRGNALIKPVDFVPMDEYDPLLWACDVNFVRGEDSFVRAQWAGKPFVWHVYQQEGEAHLVKLAAFLDRYCVGMETDLALIVRRMFVAWNTGGDVWVAWRDFLDRRHEIGAHNRRWADQLASLPDLATALVNFCAAKV